MTTSPATRAPWPASLPVQHIPVELVEVPSSHDNRLATLEARAAEEIVGLLLAAEGALVEWSKSPHALPMLYCEVSWGRYPQPVRINVAASLGGAFLRRQLLVTTNGEPRCEPGPRQCRTGHFERLLTIDSAPPAEFWALFLARTDVRFGRSRIWHPRDPLVAEGLPAPFRAALTHGRCGEFLWPQA